MVRIIEVIVLAVYLTLTMAFFERFGITPESVGGVIGWILIVEVPRVIIYFSLVRRRFIK